MRHHNVGAGSSHRFCVVSIKTIGSRHQFHFMSQTDHIDLQTVAHTGFFQVLPEQPVNQTDRREILYSREAGLRYLLKKQRHLTKGSVPQTPARTGESLTIVKTSLAISMTIALASPYGIRRDMEPRPAIRHRPLL